MRTRSCRLWSTSEVPPPLLTATAPADIGSIQTRSYDCSMRSVGRFVFFSFEVYFSQMVARNLCVKQVTTMKQSQYFIWIYEFIFLAQRLEQREQRSSDNEHSSRSSYSESHSQVNMTFNLTVCYRIYKKSMLMGDHVYVNRCSYLFPFYLLYLCLLFRWIVTRCWWTLESLARLRKTANSTISCRLVNQNIWFLPSSLSKNRYFS